MSILASLGRILGAMFCFVLLAVTIFYFYQERIIFFPEVLAPDFRFRFSQSFREANLDLGSGRRINYLVFEVPAPQGTILYFHGNAGSLKDWGWVGDSISKMTGWNVWIMDYPGYGKSTGPLPKNEKVLLEMGRVLIATISNTEPRLPLVLYGRSIGSGIASALATESRVVGLVLETPYKSLGKLGHEIYPVLPEFFSRFDLDNEKSIRSIGSKPVLLIHGDSDSIIPVGHSEALGQLAANGKLVQIAHGEHNNLSEFPEYWKALDAFLKKLVL